MNLLALNNNNRPNNEEEDKVVEDSFAERAEVYYRKRPQLLALLQDLYNGYLCLADRYCRRHHSSQITAVQLEEQLDHYNNEEEEGETDDMESEVESSLSYQPSPPTLLNPALDVDAVVAELVIKMVDYDLLENELTAVERRCNESSRKIELQKSLLEVLESERLILLNENARLGYRVATLAEESKGLAAEALFMKRKAGELARCVLEMREDHRVCVLSRKIQDLQGQIYSLERRNKDYYQQLVKRDTLQLKLQDVAGKAKKSNSKKRSKNRGEVTLEDCFQVDEEEEEEETGGAKKACVHAHGGGGGRKAYKWWNRVKNFDIFLCGHEPNFKFS